MTLRTLLRTAILAALALPALAQKTYTAADYKQAEKWMGYNTISLVDHSVTGVTFLADGRVLFRDPSAAGGTEYRIAAPSANGWTSSLAFDHAKLAKALSVGQKAAVDPKRLGVTEYTPETGGGFAVTVRGTVYRCDAAVTTCTTPATNKATPAPAQQRGRRAPSDVSPDKKLAAFIKNDNLWVRDIATGTERALTTDGIKDFGYATDNAGWTHSDAAIVVWSADSKKIATFQQDQRKTGMMYLVPVTYRHPELEAWRYPLLGDKEITKIERVVIDVATGTTTRLKMPADEHRSTLCDDVSCRGGSGWDDVQFSPDAKQIYFVSTSRDHKDEWLRAADTTTGEVREIYHEHAPTYFESGQGKVNWSALPETNEFIWYSERSDWGQLYLYDLTTGKEKNEITKGDGCVTQVLAIDRKNRMLYFEATGKEKGRDPYYTHLYRVNFDGTGQTLLTPEDANHVVSINADGSLFTDTYSTATIPATTVLRDGKGALLATLAKQDITALKAAGWKPPMPVTVKARDNKTDLFGFVWTPTGFNTASAPAGTTLPVVVYVYPGPQIGSCPNRSFHASSNDNQSLAELGFAVVCIDGMGTPYRSKSFHDAHASSPEVMGEATIPDQVAAVKQLAERFPWMDIHSVGIWGHSGGGNATASAMFHYPEFFKVGISESGNHDQRDYEDDWDEKYAGLEKLGPKGESNYDAQANWTYAKNLKGKLLLAHGTMDDNVPPNNTLLVVDALIKANKDFDLLLIPNVHHGYAEASQYMTRRRWDYFVKNLAGATPPDNYLMTPYDEVIRRMFANGPAEGEEEQ